MKRIISLLSITLFFTSCEFTVSTNTLKKQKLDLGEIPEVKKKTFKNIYVANENICRSKKLPITRFAIEYPDSLDVTFPSNERDHINIKKWDNNFIIEEVSIGNSTVTFNTKSNAPHLLEGLTEEFKRQLPDLKIDFIGKKDFKGELVYLFQGNVDFSGYEEHGYTGTYNLIGLLPLPQKQKDMNAVLVTFLANENSEIKSFEDFESLGMINQVWSSFRYIE